MATAKKNDPKKPSKAELERQRKENQNTTGTDLEILKNLEKSLRTHKTAEGIKRNTQKSLKWFSEYVPRSRNKVRTAQMFRDRNTWSDVPKMGKMMFFDYSNPVHKDKLPFYDAYPLVFVWDTFRSAAGKQLMIGINLHLLPPSLRYVAMSELLKLRSEPRYRESTKLALTWDKLKAMASHKLFEHSVRMYRLDHVMSKFVIIPAQSWELALFLPLQRIQKGGKEMAWKIN